MLKKEPTWGLLGMGLSTQADFIHIQSVLNYTAAACGVLVLFVFSPLW
jgi:hypothetical protein